MHATPRGWHALRLVTAAALVAIVVASLANAPAAAAHYTRAPRLLRPAATPTRSLISRLAVPGGSTSNSKDSAPDAPAVPRGAPWGPLDLGARIALLPGLLGVALFLRFLLPQSSKGELTPLDVQEFATSSSRTPADDLPTGGLQRFFQTATAVITASTLTLNGAMGPAPAIALSDRPSITLTREEETNVKLFRKNTPSVVYITNLATVGRINENDWSLDLTEIPRGSGTGFVWDDEGHIVTNQHVVAGASDLRVTTIDQSAYKAKVLGFDEDKDVAVLQVLEKEAISKFRPVQAGSSKGLLVGQKVLAIGNPFGLDHTLTQGIISGLGRVITSPNGRPITGVIQTDAAINPGNSGGPLLDSAGNVIGMNSAILDPTGQGSNSGVGFAIPIDIVKSVTNQLLQFGRVLRPVIGITIAPDATLQSLNVEGVLVLDVPGGSPADVAGIKPSRRDTQTGRLVLGDIIIAIQGKKVANASDLFSTIDDFLPGETVKVTVLRDDDADIPRRVDISVTLGERGVAVD